MTKDEIKAITTVPEVLREYGIAIKRGRCRAICHDDPNYTAKISDSLYYCFVCNKSMDVFDLAMHFNNCDFKTAFELLGGTEKPSFTATVKANLARKERGQRIARERENKAELRKIQNYITAYRNIIAKSEPLSFIWCYCQNKLQYQIYLLDYYNEKR